MIQGIGNKAQAITELEGALAGESQILAWLGHAQLFDGLRAEPRFQSLLKRLHFVDELVIPL